jgi:hypothetical protein
MPRPSLNGNDKTASLILCRLQRRHGCGRRPPLRLQRRCMAKLQEAFADSFSQTNVSFRKQTDFALFAFPAASWHDACLLTSRPAKRVRKDAKTTVSAKRQMTFRVGTAIMDAVRCFFPRHYFQRGSCGELDLQGQRHSSWRQLRQRNRHGRPCASRRWVSSHEVGGSEWERKAHGPANCL